MAHTLDDYREALKPLDNQPSSYTHEVLTAAGRVFSIHKSEDEAVTAANRIGGSTRPFTPNPTHYWDHPDQGSNYDH